MTEATPEQLTLRSQRMGALPLLGFFHGKHSANPCTVVKATA